MVFAFWLGHLQYVSWAILLNSLATCMFSNSSTEIIVESILFIVMGRWAESLWSWSKILITVVICSDTIKSNCWYWWHIGIFRIHNCGSSLIKLLHKYVTFNYQEKNHIWVWEETKHSKYWLMSVISTSALFYTIDHLKCYAQSLNIIITNRSHFNITATSVSLIIWWDRW